MAALLALLVLLAPRSAPAQDRGRATGLFEAAQTAEREGRFADALALHREALAIDPSAPTAARARIRASWLAARAEGSFEPLAALERVRASVELQRDRGAVDGLARAADGFPPGLVRSEARLLCAGLFIGGLDDPARALTLLEAVAADEAADRLSRSLAVIEMVRARRQLGDLAGAAADVDRFGDLVAPALATRVHREARRIHLRRGASALLAILGAVGVLAAVRVAGRRGARELLRSSARPVLLVFGLYLAVAGGALAYAYDGATPLPFAAVGAGVLVLGALGRAWGAAGFRHLAWLRGPACAAGLLAVAFLALDLTDSGYLDSFGL